MINFKIKDAKEEEPPVEISLVKDVDGDVIIVANGVKIAFLDSKTGTLKRYVVYKEVHGLQFDTNNKIAIHTGW